MVGSCLEHFDPSISLVGRPSFRSLAFHLYWIHFTAYLCDPFVMIVMVFEVQQSCIMRVHLIYSFQQISCWRASVSVFMWVASLGTFLWDSSLSVARM